MIKIKKNQTADTRTCDFTKVSEEELLESTKNHIGDVNKGMCFLAEKLMSAGLCHDYSKLEIYKNGEVKIDTQFYKDFKTGFKETNWWERHQKLERHHFNNPEHIQDDIDLIDVLEQLVDGVMAGMARSGKYRDETPSPELLLKAYKNTAKLLLDQVEVTE